MIKNTTSSEIPFGNEGEIKIFSDEGKVRQFAALVHCQVYYLKRMAIVSSPNRKEMIFKKGILAIGKGRKGMASKKTW